MTLSKQVYDRAKQKALERLTGWATDTKLERDNGIPRLQDEFKHVFRKIEWKNKGLKHTKSDKKDVTQEEKKTQQGGKRISELPKSTEPLEDYRRHDSNSSNVSSRLDTDKEISDNVPVKSRRSTPGPIKSFTPADALQKSLKDSLLSELEDEASRRQREAEKQQTNAHVLARISRRKRKRKQKKQVAPPSADSTQTAPKTSAHMDDATEGADEGTGLGHKLGTGSKSRTKSIAFTGKGGALELVLKRNIKQGKLRSQESKDEIPEFKPEEKQSIEDRRKVVLAKFRRLVRQLIHVRVLLNVARFKIEEEEKEKLKQFKIEDGRELTFDATAFKSAMTSYGGLTSRARKALRKIPEDRNEEDETVLMEIMLRLPLFEKYPKSVKQGLARMLWYDRFREGRVIVKQGDPGSRMYFVVSGPGVSLRRTDRFDKEGEPVSYQYRSVGAGSTFGELALIRDMRRDYTAVCIGTSEFLSLTKSEFNTVLRNRWEKECNIRYNFLRASEYFRSWTDQQLQACADSSELKEYQNNTVILGNIAELSDSVFFIRRGRCEVVRRIMMVKHQSPYLRSTLLLPHMTRHRPDFMNKPYGHRLRAMREEYVYLTVTILESGCYFGVGEDLTDTYIVAKGKTECIVVSSAQFSIQGKSELLRNLKNDLEVNLPTNSEMYRKFQINRKWFAYRKKVLNEVIGKRKSYASVNDVPTSVRNAPTIHLKNLL